MISLKNEFNEIIEYILYLRLYMKITFSGFKYINAVSYT